MNSKVTKNSDITGATKCKITYDKKGLVTKGEDLTADDIPNLEASKITSGKLSNDRLPSDISGFTVSAQDIKASDNIYLGHYIEIKSNYEDLDITSTNSAKILFNGKNLQIEILDWTV